MSRKCSGCGSVIANVAVTQARSSSLGAMMSTQIGFRVAISSGRMLTNRPWSKVKIFSMHSLLLKLLRITYLKTESPHLVGRATPDAAGKTRPPAKESKKKKYFKIKKKHCDSRI